MRTNRYRKFGETILPDANWKNSKSKGVKSENETMLQSSTIFCNYNMNRDDTKFYFAVLWSDG